MSLLPRPSQIQARDAMGAYRVPTVNSPAPERPAVNMGTVQTSLDGYQPYAGRDPMIGRVAAPNLAYSAPMSPPLGRGAIDTAMTGPNLPSGNTTTSFNPDQQSPPSAQGATIREQVRAMVRGNGGMPAELEAAFRSGNPAVDMQSNMPRQAAIGLAAGLRPSSNMEGHDPSGRWRR